MRNKLISLVKKVKADIVYTMAGPAYVNFPVFHIMGISNPYITHANWDSFKLRGSPLSVLSYLLYVFVQLTYSKKADFFVFQTEQARKSYSKRTGISVNSTSVIPNAFDENMLSLKNNNEFKNNNDIFRIFCPGAEYIHKGFQFIPEIAKALKKDHPHAKVEFVVTLPDSGNLWHLIKSKAENLGVNTCIKNIGPYSYSKASELYASANMVFVPSVLETFSATYLEAMAAKKPLLVADKPFARDICEEYAWYINPKRPAEASVRIIEIMGYDIENSNKLQIGDRILRKYGNHEERYMKIQNLLLDFMKVRLSEERNTRSGNL
jgi:glycosyltransferase involved in cell wall biosynthesis